ncbi:methyltransferase domain-containing protein [bacterium]|nr:methyltransferase domain-containing protein [bacterium]
MNKQKKIDSRDIGLEIGLILGQYFFNTEHLHYGYWAGDLDINLKNLPQAQKNYCHFIISQIPEGIKTILDVGCGVGRSAFELINKGYRVDCVSPSPVLTERARMLLGEQSHIFECDFENIQTENRYDMILFSESFQYIKLEKALQNSVKLLNKDGYLLICDFFKTDAKGKSVLGGGHKLAKFYEFISQYPLIPIKDMDITKETAPNLDIINGFLSNVGFPIWKTLIHFLDTNYHFISRLIHWKYNRKIKKINRKYFSGARNARNFSIYKSYRLLLYKNVSA